MTRANAPQVLVLRPFSDSPHVVQVGKRERSVSLMVLKVVRSFTRRSSGSSSSSSSDSPHASAASLSVKSLRDRQHTPVTATSDTSGSLQEVPETHEHVRDGDSKAAKAETKRKAKTPRKERNQQELELDDFKELEEKSPSCDSSEDDGARSDDLIEISLGGGGGGNHVRHRHQHKQSQCYDHSASDLETIDELIEYTTAGDLPNFKRVCDGLGSQNVSADSPGYMGWTPAHWAAREGHVHILDYLLHQAHANLDAVDRKGDSLLHKAAANEQYRACQWLLQYGFNVQTKNNNGLSALDVTQEHLAIARTSEATLCEAILAHEYANTF